MLGAAPFCCSDLQQVASSSPIFLGLPAPASFLRSHQWFIPTDCDGHSRIFQDFSVVCAVCLWSLSCWRSNDAQTSASAQIAWGFLIVWTCLPSACCSFPWSEEGIQPQSVIEQPCFNVGSLADFSSGGVWLGLSHAYLQHLVFLLLFKLKPQCLLLQVFCKSLEGFSPPTFSEMWWLLLPAASR